MSCDHPLGPRHARTIEGAVKGLLLPNLLPCERELEAISSPSVFEKRGRAANGDSIIVSDARREWLPREEGGRERDERKRRGLSSFPIS